MMPKSDMGPHGRTAAQNEDKGKGHGAIRIASTDQNALHRDRSVYVFVVTWFEMQSEACCFTHNRNAIQSPTYNSKNASCRMSGRFD